MNRNDRPVLRAVTILVGLMTALIGILFIAVPAIAKIGNEWILAAMFIAGGVMTAGFAATTLHADVRVYTVLLTILSIGTGLTALINPLDRSITLTTLLGMYFMVEAALYAGIGTSLRRYTGPSVLMMAIAMISFVMSMMIWLYMAGSPKTVILSLLGISFIARGLAYVLLSLMMRGQAPLAPSASQPGKAPQPTGA